MTREHVIERASVTPPERDVFIDYTNWKGERRTRRIQPISIGFGNARPWYVENQWLLTAYDVEKREFRFFAMERIHSWSRLTPEERIKKHEQDILSARPVA